LTILQVSSPSLYTYAEWDHVWRLSSSFWK
jgi:hypothetical protein